MRRAVSFARSNGHLYLFSWGDEVRKAVHAIEVPFAFDNAQRVRRRANGSPEVDPLAKIMSDTLVAFARTGKARAKVLYKSWRSMPLPIAEVAFNTVDGNINKRPG
jgi:carboxylesterase type B